MIRKAPLFILRNDNDGPKKIIIGEVVLFDAEGILDSARIVETLFYEHPENGDVELDQEIRFLIKKD